MLMDSQEEPLCTEKREPNVDFDISPNLNYTHRADDVQPTLRKEITVAVVGNGPASIFLSLLLSGYWPYFSGTHPDEFLCARLKENEGKSILEQDLEMLSAGLEGRSSNPIALLLDTLLRPYTDVGGIYPSSLVWKYDPQKAISHVVIGRGLPGGSWQYMEPNLKSLSLGSWLDLPLYSFADWTAEQEEQPQERYNNQPSTDSDHTGVSDVLNGRVLAGNVAHYYSDYVVRMGIAENFLDNCEVDQVTSLDKSMAQVCSKEAATSGCSSCSSPASVLDSPLQDDSLSPHTSSVLIKTEWEHFTDICSVIVDDDCGIHCPDTVKCTRRRDCSLKWYLRGSQKSNEREGDREGDGESKVCIFSKKLVLACGVSGQARLLGVPGEESPFVTHHVLEFVKRVNLSRPNENEIVAGTPTVVVVGAGLSAADAVLRALDKGLKVIHVFHQNPNDHRLVFDRIPQRTYPDYAHLHGLMKGKVTDECYICRSESHICEFREDDRSVSISNSAGPKEMWTNISFGGVFIGTDVNLGFLPDNLVRQLATDPHVPVNAKHNPVDVNQTSFVFEAVPSLYAIGSLTGDNFVRFGIGSALGASQHILGL